MRLKKVLCALGVGLFFTAAASAEKSDDELLIKARGGDVSSQLKLADEYFFGRGKRKADSRLAAYWFRKAAERHDAKAQFNYGVCCLKGWGVPASAQTGYLWISRAAEQNLEAAQIMQAELLFSGIAPELDSHRRFPAISADPQKSIDVLTKLFENGSASAAKTLAKLLLSDASMRKKYPFLLRKSSKFSAEKMAWDVESVLVYSTVLQNGIGGEVDNKKTLALLRSIENRSPEAMARLADMYEYGLSVPPDPEKALELCRRAAVNGSPRAIHAMGTRYLEANAVEHSPEKAFKLFEQAWKAQYPAASASLGKCYLGGIGTMKDENRAFELFMQGAAAGDPESQYQLGLCFLNGIGTAGDAAGAVHWFKAASSAGLPDAMRELGKSLVRGVGTKKNIQYGRQLLEEAVKLGDIQAAEFLRGEVSQ